MDPNINIFVDNQVRLCNGLDHQNIVSFCEWYETSNHLWLVMELCTGGSLESVIGQDGCLSEDVVLLDGEGILKLSNFCLSRTEGESLEEFFTMLSLSDQTGGEGDKDISESGLRKRIQDRRLKSGASGGQLPKIQGHGDANRIPPTTQGTTRTRQPSMSYEPIDNNSQGLGQDPQRRRGTGASHLAPHPLHPSKSFSLGNAVP
ncbi:hypothetical protein CRUP_011975 [Coryphaenoides rupestris]|nr:hypothetical protein CRUP_011975 [Coryphaenoides rupestris]